MIWRDLSKNQKSVWRWSCLYRISMLGNKVCSANHNIPWQHWPYRKKVALFSTTNGHIKPETFDIYADIIRLKGGEVLENFFLLTFFKNLVKVKQETKGLKTKTRLLVS